MLVDEIVARGFSGHCVICARLFTDDDFRASDVEAVVNEPLFQIGRAVKTGKLIEGKEETELRMFHKGTTYHCSCYYKRKYRLEEEP